MSLAVAHTLAAPSKPTDFTSVVDILSKNAEFSTFLRLLQRNGHIPFLNELQNFTLLAPVNSAFAVMSKEKAEIDVENYILADLVLLSAEIENGTTTFSENVKFPLNIRRDANDEITVNDATIVEPDLCPNFQNATVHGISGLLPDSPKVGSLLEQLDFEHKDAQIFNSFSKGFTNFEQLVENCTLLVPLDVNFYKEFNHIEINYILDAFDKIPLIEDPIAHGWSNDRKQFLKNIICHKIIGGKEADDQKFANLAGHPIYFQSNHLGSSISINDSKPSLHSNMIFDRGVAHGFTEIPFLPSAIDFNTEKYLHGMNSTEFVRELYFRNLQRMIQDESYEKKMTIFVPETALDETFGFTKPGLLYHFLEERVWLEDQFLPSGNDGSYTRMFDSAFCSSNKRLGGHCQRLKIKKSKGAYIINDKFKILHAKPYEIGMTLIYTISEDLQLPGDFLSALNPFDRCSKSLFFLRQCELLKLPPNKEGYTVLLPCFDSWEFLDLNYEYLEKNATAVSLIMKNLILNGPIYSDAGNVTMETQNILGETVSLSVTSPSDARIEESTFQLSTIDEDIRVDKSLDSFFNQGVIHPLKSAYFPRSVNITIRDLIDTTGAIEFRDLLDQFEDFSSIVNENQPYSLLIPTASSLDMERIGTNSTNLRDFLKLHIVWGNYTKNLLNCEGRVNTTFGETLLCRESSPGIYSLRLENGADHEVRVLRKGCSSFGNESCIFLIDRPISLLWLRTEKHRLHLPGIAVAIGVIVGVFTAVAISFCLLVVFVGKSHSGDSNSSTSPSGADGAEEDSTPLLVSNNSTGPAPGRQSRKSRQRFEGTYSANASVPPMDVASTPR